MLPSRLNEMEEGFLFFSPLQQDTPDSPKPDTLIVRVCCYTYESQHFTEKSPFFFLFIYFIKIVFFFLKMFFFRYSSRHDWNLSVGAENFSIWAFFLSRTYRLSQTHTKTPVIHYSVKNETTILSAGRDDKNVKPFCVNSQYYH
jgi:hypothetical protein